MTPLNPHTPPGPGSGSNALIAIGIALGAACLGSALILPLGGKLMRNAREGWNLVPMVVAAVDIAAGEAVVMEVISQRSIPEQFLTDSVVKPDSASYVVNVRTRKPYQAGDALRWGDLFDARRDVQVFFAKSELAAGSVVDLSGLELRIVERAQITDSWVTESELKRADGKRLTTKLAPGDPLLWVHLELGSEGGAP